jgi:microcystin-dependent protein
MTTTTAKYSWQMPDPGGSPNTWGNTLNATTQAIDQQVYLNAQAGVPVGAVTMWGGSAPPANWLICDGSSLATVGTYAALFAILGYAYGGSGANFNLPNLQGVFPRGAGASNALGSTGGAASVTLATTQLPAHAHPIGDLNHSHTINQTAHSHSDSGHAHTVTETQHTHLYSEVYGEPSGQIQIGSGWGYQNIQTGGATSNISINTGYASIAAAYANITGNTTAVSPTGLTTTQNAGGGAAVPTVPPFLAINFIIKYA